MCKLLHWVPADVVNQYDFYNCLYDVQSWKPWFSKKKPCSVICLQVSWPRPGKTSMVFSCTICVLSCLGWFTFVALNTLGKVWSHPVIACSQFLFASTAILLMLPFLKLSVSKYHQILFTVTNIIRLLYSRFLLWKSPWDKHSIPSWLTSEFTFVGGFSRLLTTTSMVVFTSWFGGNFAYQITSVFSIPLCRNLP